jgi:hypothetical protein
MKPLYIKSLISLSICLIMSNFSCKNKNDEPKPNHDNPKIEEVSVFPVPQPDNICGSIDEKVIHLQSNQKLKLKLKVSATKGLSQYKIDIHHNFDCHTHRLEAVHGVEWKLIKVVNVTGTEYVIEEELTVPNNVKAGNYHFMLQAIDIEGNEAAMELYSLKIRNDADLAPPYVSISSPSSDSISIIASDSISFKLNVEDNISLKGGKIELTYLDKDNTEFTVDQYFFDTQNSTADYSFNHHFIVPPKAGKLVFILKVFDAVNNVTEKRIIVNVSQ